MNYVIPIGIVLGIIFIMLLLIIYGISRRKREDYNDHL